MALMYDCFCTTLYILLQLRLILKDIFKNDFYNVLIVNEWNMQRHNNKNAYITLNGFAH